MHFPENLKYSKDHLWIKIEKTVALIGATFFAQLELGEVAFIQVKTVGKHIQKGKVFGTVEAIEAVSDLLLPISGVVSEFNSLLSNEPALINSDPYEKGWIIKLKPDNIRDITELLSAHQYAKLVNG